MVINQISSIKTTAGPRPLSNGTLFKDVLNSKQHERLKTASVKEERQPSPVKKVLNEILTTHEITAQSLKISGSRTNYTPEKLLSFQYKTGFLLLREQMFARTAELSANTLKNFTQMQV